MMTGEFRRNSVNSLAKPSLGIALEKAMEMSLKRRAAAIDEIPNWQALRDRARSIKEDTLEHHERYLSLLTESIERRGGHVHLAADAAGARAIIDGIIDGRGPVIKGKSMVSEEVELTPHLSAQGLEVYETDLGEFIAQLAGQRPSHITAPVIHMNRQEIAGLFEKHLGCRYTEEPEALTRYAREFLREKFMRAQVGITGVNFAVAGTGQIVLVENEGNITITTDRPKLHIALMSIEKMVPSFEDLGIFITMLPRSATGQRIASYISVLSPPAEGAEFHLVVLDGGRSAIIGDPKMRESLYCIRCGACMNVCPVYRKVGGHAYHSVYPGPIGAVLSPQLFGADQYSDLPYASTLCGLCNEVCPVKIDLAGLLVELRARVGAPNGALYSLWASMWQRRGLYKLTLPAMRRAIKWMKD